MTTIYTVREGIVAQIVAILDPIKNVVVYRSREAAVSRDEGVTILVRPDEEAVQMNASGLALRDLTVSVTVIGRGPIPDQVVDPILQLMHAALMADQTLGGRVARCIEESTKWDYEVADQNAVAAEVKFRIRYLTPTSTLAATV